MRTGTLSAVERLILLTLILVAGATGKDGVASAQSIPVTLSSDAPDPVAGPFTVQAQFGAKVMGFTAQDLITTHATVSNFKAFSCTLLAAGWDNCLAIRADGTLAGWRDSYIYTIGEVPAGNNFVAVAAGGTHNLALRIDGTVAAWGYNNYGQCNVPAGNDTVAIAVGFSHSLALHGDGTLAAWGLNLDGQCNVPAGNNFVAIAAGDYHNLALRSDGSLVAWGDNLDGQCNVPAGNNYVAITGGENHSLALRSNGSLAAWGDNSYGQCDVPAGTNFVAIAAGGNHGLALRADGSLTAWGRNNYGQINVPAGNNFVAVGAGKEHCLALRSDGTVAAWGNNTYGQTNVPAGLVVRQPLTFSNFTLTPTSFGEVAVAVPSGVAQGVDARTNAESNKLTRTYNGAGSLQITITPADVVALGAKWRRVGTTTWLESGATETAIAVGDHPVEFKPIHGWTQPANITVPIVHAQTTAETGTYSAATIAVTLSSDAPTSITGPFMVKAQFNDRISGFSTEDLVTTRATVSNFKSFSCSSLVVKNSSSPDDRDFFVLGTDGALNAWGDNLYGECNVPAGNNYVAVAAGELFGMALRLDGSLAAWGDNSYGECNVPAGNNYVAIAAGATHCLALRADGSITTWGNTHSPGSVLWNVPAGNNFVAIGAGVYHSVALRADGTLVAWGFNTNGQCTVPTGNNFTAIAAGPKYNLALCADGSLAAWGYQFDGQLNVPAGNDFTAIAAGQMHCLALRADGSLVTWGDTDWGELDVPAGNDFVAIAAGNLHSLALHADGTLTAWGENENDICIVPEGLDALPPITISSFTMTPSGIGQVAVAIPAGVAQGENSRPNAASNKLTRSYYGVGSLQVNITPAEAVAAGAKWRRVGTTPWLSSGATETGLVATQWEIEYKDVADWTRPANQTPVLVNGQTTQVSGVYLRHTGTLRVTLTPAGAIAVGAAWSIDGGANWQASGASLSLPTGSYTVKYKSITDWLAPADSAPTIQKDQETAVSGTYLPTGNLQVTITPAKAITAGAQWRRVGTTPWLASGASETLAVGLFMVEFKTVTGWVAPSSRGVTIAQGQTATSTGAYTRPSVTLSSTAPNPTSTSPIPVTATFSSALTDFDAGELILTNATATDFAGSGTSYTFKLIPKLPGQVSVSIAGSTPLIRNYTGLATEVWVNFAWRGSEIGSPAQPYNTLTEGVAAILAGCPIKLVGPNVSGEKLRITKAMRLEAVTGAVRIGVNGVAIPAPPSN